MSRIKTGDCITMIYVSEKGVVTKRTVKVLSITAHYMTGYCYMRRQFRTFKRTNMLACEKTRQLMEV
ncbi:MAG TPA: hypothetical protein VK029_06940 [Pseudogracilibacillus sp.]|nr:hypothetical protein [Pseudogracilibacillus sp.]